MTGNSTVMRGGGIEDVSQAKESPKVLGEFEYSVMLAVQVLGPDAYGAEISRFLLERIGRKLALAQVYVTLSRLEKKGLLDSESKSPRPVRGGRARKVFVLADCGLRALDHSTAIRKAMIASTEEIEVTNGALAKT